MLAGFFLLAILGIKLFPDTNLGRSLHLHLVELPVRLAHGIERKDIILVAIILVAGQTLALAGSAELAMAYAVDMSIYADAVLVTSVATAASRFRYALAACKAALVRVAPAWRPRPRSRKYKPAAPRPGTACNDDDDHRWSRVAQAA